jgi:Tat protein secretion system quality control protein TatD with DNase activity
METINNSITGKNLLEKNTENLQSNITVKDMIDSHTHLHVIKDENLLKDIIENSISNGVSTICENATREDNFDLVLNLKKQYPNNFVCGLGIHPYYFESASKDYIEVI